MRQTEASVAGFLAAVPDEQRRQDARRLCAMMRELTGEPPMMGGQPPGTNPPFTYREETVHKHS